MGDRNRHFGRMERSSSTPPPQVSGGAAEGADISAGSGCCVGVQPGGVGWGRRDREK